MRLISLVCLLSLSALASLPAAIAIVNQAVVSNEVDRQVLRNCLLGRTTVWPGGVPVVVVISREEQDAQVVNEVSGRGVAQLLRGWKRLAFSGNGVMPMVVSNSDRALENVESQRGAVAVLSAVPEGELSPSVRVVPLSDD